MNILNDQNESLEKLKSQNETLSDKFSKIKTENRYAWDKFHSILYEKSLMEIKLKSIKEMFHCYEESFLSLDKEVTHRIKSIPTKKAYQLCDESKEVSYSLLVRFEIKDMNYANHEAVVYFDVKLFYRDKLQEAIETLSRTFESKINPNRLLEVF